jgi:hypothetical protein
LLPYWMKSRQPALRPAGRRYAVAGRVDAPASQWFHGVAIDSAALLESRASVRALTRREETQSDPPEEAARESFAAVLQQRGGDVGTAIAIVARTT